MIFLLLNIPRPHAGGFKQMQQRIYARNSDSLCTIFALSSFLPLNGIIILCIVPFFCPIMHKKSKTAMFYGLLNAQAPLFRLPGPQNRSFFPGLFTDTTYCLFSRLSISKKGIKNMKNSFTCRVDDEQHGQPMWNFLP